MVSVVALDYGTRGQEAPIEPGEGELAIGVEIEGVGVGKESNAGAGRVRALSCRWSPAVPASLRHEKRLSIFGKVLDFWLFHANSITVYITACT